VVEACTIAGLGRTKIYEAIADRQLKARKFGKRTIILRSDLERFLTALPEAT
jgi:excisionase family DNA binding protein